MLNVVLSNHFGCCSPSGLATKLVLPTFILGRRCSFRRAKAVKLLSVVNFQGFFGSDFWGKECPEVGTSRVRLRGDGIGDVLNQGSKMWHSTSSLALRFLLDNFSKFHLWLFLAFQHLARSRGFHERNVSMTHWQGPWLRRQTSGNISVTSHVSCCVFEA